MAWLSFREVRKNKIVLIHARSYTPAVVALFVGGILRVPFIFDMRALWPEELITAGRLKRGSMIHRAIAACERSCLRRAGAVVALTNSAASYLRGKYSGELEDQIVRVIPTCADLTRFRPGAESRSKPVIGCLGTVLSGWFRLDWLSAFLNVVAKSDSDLRFEITTRDDPEVVRRQLAGTPEIESRLSVAPCASEIVHEVLQGQVASVMFYAGGQVSELGRSPTRMAEILGCGVPVVANEGVGDVADIIRKFRVGVLVRSVAYQDMESAFFDLQDLLKDPDLSARCRRAAEEVFSLEAGTKAYMALYSDVLSKFSRVSGEPF